MNTLKHTVKKTLQSILGFERYLFVFSIFKIITLPWERSGEGDFNLFLKMLPRDGVVLDIGANIGIMTVLLARHVNKGAVHAFEPIPPNHAVLRKIVALYGLRNVTVHEIALGDQDIEVEMVLPIHDSVKLQGFGHIMHPRITGYPDGEHFRVAARKLDGIAELGTPGLHITGIKIDVQEFEYFVLRGGEQLISTHRPIIYCEIGGAYAQDTVTLLHSLGYQVMVADHGHLTAYHPATHHTAWNFIAVPSESSVSAA